ncbi:MAG: IS1595 family transposase [Alphaproteobacteria bacterium]|nr:IS1595 family transposase [Alphaproteobacteria bacterium]QQS57108.1 MAG: IS1595 family transposase [Alphaproteobacteria bacterium]
MSVLNQAHFHDEKAAYAFVEARLWADGRICPHCGTVDRSGALNSKSDSKNKVRIGVYKCYECRKPFTVKVGTIFESSHIKLHVWLQAMFLISSSKKGVSANQLHRTLGITLKSAWFLSHRIREAMRDGAFDLLGGEGKIVEADETYYGNKSGPAPTHNAWGTPYPAGKGGAKRAHKCAIVSLVERGGKIRSFHVDRADKATVARIVVENVAKESHLHTDESLLYKGAEAHVAEHHSVRHANKEYVRGNVHNNSVEGSFGIFKRGMKGVYQHCDEKHLHRYLSEFDFRYNNRTALGYNDEDRTATLLRGVVGKRLTYERIGKAKDAREKATA